MKVIPSNPYIVGNPIKTRRMFFGREDDFQFVQKKLGEGAANQILVFCGERRSGKTSILFQILGDRLGKRFLPVLVDMQILAGIKSDQEFFNAILKNSCKAIRHADLSFHTLTEQVGKEDIRGLFNTFLDFIKEKFPGSIVLFLIDEFEIIEEKIKEGTLSELVIHYLAGILESQHRVSFIFTGSTNLEKRKGEFWKPLLAKSLYKKISYLSQNDSFRLITEPLGDYIRYEEAIVSAIYRLTAGQPFYTQVICQNLVDLLMDEERDRPTAGDLERIVKEITDNPLPQMIYSWNNLSRWDKLALSGLGMLLKESSAWGTAKAIHKTLKTNKIILPVKKERIKVLLEEGYQKEFLSKKLEEDAYQFKLDLFRRWIRREHSLWKIVREVGLAVKAPVNRLVFLLLLTSAVLVVLTAGFFLYRGLFPDKSPTMQLADNKQAVSEEDTAVNPPLNNIRLTSNLGPFRARIDGRLNLTSAGQEDETTIIIPNLESGPHLFMFQHPLSEEEITLSVDVENNNQIIAVKFDEDKIARIKSASPAQPGTQEPGINLGAFFISTIPPGAEIRIDGKDSTAQTPYLMEKLSPGKHSVELILTGYKTEQFEIMVERGKTVKKELNLAATYGQLLLDVRPTAKIYLDGVFTIETPYTKPLPIQTGKHLLTIENETLDFKREIAIDITEDETLEIVEVIK